MKLKEYLDTYCVKITGFAKRIRKTPRYIYWIIDGGKPSVNAAMDIEKATEGKVTKEELLFPNDYQNKEMRMGE